MNHKYGLWADPKNIGCDDERRFVGTGWEHYLFWAFLLVVLEHLVLLTCTSLHWLK